MQDIEFTIQEELYILQCRTGKGNAEAATKIAVNMVDEGLIDKATALSRVNNYQLQYLASRTVDPAAIRSANVLVYGGIPASIGAATGEMFIDDAHIIDRARQNIDVILTKKLTSQPNLEAMRASKGFLTSEGGTTSHAAVVAKGWEIPCIVGCDGITVDEERLEMIVGSRVFHEGDRITMDANGRRGIVYEGILPLVKRQLAPECDTFLRWVEESKH